MKANSRSRRRARWQPRCCLTWIALLGIAAGSLAAPAQETSNEQERQPVWARRPEPKEQPRLPLSSEERAQLDKTVDRGLEYLAAHQDSDGSFQTTAVARPAVTALCVMAFFSRGHKPGEGTYGAAIERGIDYVLEFQDSDGGAITPPMSTTTAGFWTRAGSYTHGICSTMLADAYPMTGKIQYQKGREESQEASLDRRRHQKIEHAVRKALAFTHGEQQKPKTIFGEQGGWRYINVDFGNQSDLSVTAWMVMFLHSAKQSGFKVNDKWIQGALRFVHHTFSKKLHGFVYVLSDRRRHCTRATVGGGILCLLLGGESVSQQVKEAAAWISMHPFEPYNQSFPPGDRYHYSAFYCSQAMGLLGGQEFRDFYPQLLRVLSLNQHTDGSWEAESFASDAEYGQVYSTALAILALSPPYENLKTYQPDHKISARPVASDKPKSRRGAASPD